MNEFKDYFLSLINGSFQSWKTFDDPIIYYKDKDDNILLTYNSVDGIFYYSPTTIGPKLKEKSGLDYNEINELLETILRDHFNCEVVSVHCRERK